MTRHLLRCTLIACLVAGQSLGALPTTTGREPGLWTDGNYCVVVGTIHEIRRNTADNRVQASLVPKATLAGSFDPSLHPQVRVDFRTGTTSSIRHVPAKGATVLAVIRWGMAVEEGSHTRKANWIVSDLCTFMPDRSALVVITGLDDPRVAQTLERIREARANPEPDPNAATTTSATRPATRPVGE